ncbi:MAG: hypothetical protein ACYDDB_02795 [bacterium]
MDIFVVKGLKAGELVKFFNAYARIFIDNAVFNAIVKEIKSVAISRFTDPKLISFSRLTWFLGVCIVSNLRRIW